jgi:hypothetical protein
LIFLNAYSLLPYLIFTASQFEYFVLNRVRNHYTGRGIKTMAAAAAAAACASRHIHAAATP